MKVRLFSFGRDRTGLFEPAVAEYAKRLGHYCHFELVPLPAAKVRAGVSGADAEAEVVLGKLGPKDDIVALDERGRSLTSQQFAQTLAAAQSRARDLAFIIGGDEGLSDQVRNKATLVVSLSSMTLSHRLARVVLAEQLYRGFSILRGEPYAK